MAKEEYVSGYIFQFQRGAKGTLSLVCLFVHFNVVKR